MKHSTVIITCVAVLVGGALLSLVLVQESVWYKVCSVYLMVVTVVLIERLVVWYVDSRNDNDYTMAKFKRALDERRKQDEQQTN